MFPFRFRDFSLAVKNPLVVELWL
jgi:hypothetical protein